MKVDKVAVIIRDTENYWEALRSCLGLGCEMIETHMFVLGEVGMPKDRVQAYKENLEFLGEELDGRNFTDSKANIEKWNFFRYMALDDMAEKLREYDLLIPF